MNPNQIGILLVVLLILINIRLGILAEINSTAPIKSSGQTVALITSAIVFLASVFTICHWFANL